MTSKEVWRPIPMKFAILDVLEKRQGLILDDELRSALRRIIGDFSEKELNRVLMSLESLGKIHVMWITKTKRRIELLKEGVTFLAVDED